MIDQLQALRQILERPENIKSVHFTCSLIIKQPMIV
jgi:hypothetical protein